MFTYFATCVIITCTNITCAIFTGHTHIIFYSVFYLVIIHIFYFELFLVITILYQDMQLSIMLIFGIICAFNVSTKTYNIPVGYN